MLRRLNVPLQRTSRSPAIRPLCTAAGRPSSAPALGLSQNHHQSSVLAGAGGATGQVVRGFHTTTRTLQLADQGKNKNPELWGYQDPQGINPASVIILTPEDPSGDACGWTDHTGPLDPLARSRVANFVKRHQATFTGKGAEYEGGAEHVFKDHIRITPVTVGTEVQYHAKVKVPFNDTRFSTRLAEGWACNPRDAELCAVMHAELIIDTLGFHIYKLESLQAKHSETKIKNGGWAPAPGDNKKEPSTRSPLPLRRVLKDQSEGGMYRMIDANVRSPFRTPNHTILSPGLPDPNAASRIQALFAAKKKDIKDFMNVTETEETVKVPSSTLNATGEVADAPKQMWTTVRVELPVPDEFGVVVGVGKAQSKQTATVLACMHAELSLDTLGLPVFPDNKQTQTEHAAKAVSFGRWAPGPDEKPKHPNTPLPKPFKALKPSEGPKAATDGTKVSDDERFVKAHFEACSLTKNHQVVSDPDMSAKSAIEHFQKSQVGSHPFARDDFYFVEKVGSVYRCSIVLPVNEVQHGVKVAVGIGHAPGEAELLACMHAVELLNFLGIAVYSGNEQLKHQEKRTAANKFHAGDGQERNRMVNPLPPPMRRMIPNPPQKSPSNGQVNLNFNANRNTVGEAYWTFKPDTQDGFILVSPRPPEENPTVDGHTIKSVRLSDPSVKERVQQYIEYHGMRIAEALTTTSITSADGRQMFRSVIQVPVPAAYGPRRAIGEAENKKDATGLAAMHAELIVDALGLSLYPSNPPKQAAHAEAARRLGRPAAVPGESSAPANTTTPPGLRKVPEDTAEWAEVAKNLAAAKKAGTQHQQQQPAAGGIDVGEIDESMETEQLEEVDMDGNCTGRVGNYIKRVNKSPYNAKVVRQGVGGNIVFMATLVVPFDKKDKHPPQIATGLAPVKSQAETLCYMHAERLIDALGVRMFNLPGLQKRHVDRVAAEGRWAPSNADDLKPIGSPVPVPLRIFPTSNKPMMPKMPDANLPDYEHKWQEYVGMVGQFITKTTKAMNEQSYLSERAPRSNDSLVDSALDIAEAEEPDRTVKSVLWNYCSKKGVAYPVNWKSVMAGMAGNKVYVTTIDVPGFEGITATGVSRNKETSTKKAAKHAIVIIKMLEPDAVKVEPAMNKIGETKQQKRSSTYSRDTDTGGFDEEAQQRLIDLFTVAMDLKPPIVDDVDRPDPASGLTRFKTSVEIRNFQGENWTGRCESVGEEPEEAAAYTELFLKLKKNVPQFRELMNLMRRQRKLDPENVMSLEIPEEVKGKIQEITQEKPTAAAADTSQEALAEAAAAGVDSMTGMLLAKTAEHNSDQNDSEKEKLAKRSAVMKREMEEKNNAPEYQAKFHERRTTLSIHEKRQELVDTIEKNQVTVICGTTGCGKTTQVPQYILDHWTELDKGAECSVLVTQPRRISAVSISHRIADERLEPIGGNVGYTIRLDSKPGTHINFCTAGVLLRLLQANPNLDGITHVLIDEIHERDIHSDFLLILIKSVMERRKDLKMVLMSATLQSELFSSFFGGAPVINVEGFVHPVKEIFLESFVDKAQQDGVTLHSFMGIGGDQQQQQQQQRGGNRKQSNFSASTIMYAIAHACEVEDTSKGSILVFLPGWEEIRRVNEIVPEHQFHTICLHSSVGAEEQMQCFQPAPEGKVKLVLSTNIAESGITIDDICVVIDSGLVKEKSFVTQRRHGGGGGGDASSMSQLTTVRCSRANCIQRRGRAGRTRPGTCIRLYNKTDFEQLHDFQIAEMLRQPLDALCLQILSLSLGDPAHFLQRALQSPPASSIEGAMGRLTNLGAVDKDRKLTPLGLRLSVLPVAPKVGKMILYGAVLKCLDSVLTLAATTDVDPLDPNREMKEMVRVSREVFSQSSQSDHVAAINSFNTWATAHATKEDKEVATLMGNTMLFEHNLLIISQYKRQFYDILFNSGFLGNQRYKRPPPLMVDAGAFSEDATDIGLVKGVVCCGLFPNVALSNGVKKSYRCKTDNNLNTSTASVLNKVQQSDVTNPWIVFEEMMKCPSGANRVLLKGGSNTSLWGVVLLGASNFHIDYRPDLNLGMVDDWIVFRADRETTDLIYKLKYKFDNVLSKKFADPNDAENNADLEKVQVIMKTLLNLQATPNKLVGTVWEEAGKIIPATPLPYQRWRHYKLLVSGQLEENAEATEQVEVQDAATALSEGGGAGEQVVHEMLTGEEIDVDDLDESSSSADGRPATPLQGDGVVATPQLDENGKPIEGQPNQAQTPATSGGAPQKTKDLEMEELVY